MKTRNDLIDAAMDVSEQLARMSVKIEYFFGVLSESKRMIEQKNSTPTDEEIEITLQTLFNLNFGIQIIMARNFVINALKRHEIIEEDDLITTLALSVKWFLLNHSITAVMEEASIEKIMGTPPDWWSRAKELAEEIL